MHTREDKGKARRRKMSYLSVKVVLISTGILSMAMGLKLTLPLLTHFVLNEAPSVWTFFLTCFTPPYLYILLNFIILTIVATSKLHNNRNTPPDTTLHSSESLVYPPAAVHVPAPEPVKISAAPQTNYNVGYAYQMETTPSDDAVTDTVGYFPDENTPVKATAVNGDVGLSPSLRRNDSFDFAFSNENEKPPVSTRFGHRKAVRASPEGGKVMALGVAKAKKQETLENTWKTITEGRAMPLTRHLKKAETWETTQPRSNGSPLKDLNGGPVMKKSDTFGGREKKSASPSSRLRKEPSLSQDELNRRVEAFINKFNAEMRLQRQESLRQYREMMNRGTHSTQS